MLYHFSINVTLYPPNYSPPFHTHVSRTSPKAKVDLYALRAFVVQSISFTQPIPQVNVDAVIGLAVTPESVTYMQFCDFDVLASRV